MRQRAPPDCTAFHFVPRNIFQEAIIAVTQMTVPPTSRFAEPSERRISLILGLPGRDILMVETARRSWIELSDWLPASQGLRQNAGSHAQAALSPHVVKVVCHFGKR
jgi:hypothetical protein